MSDLHPDVRMLADRLDAGEAPIEALAFIANKYLDEEHRSAGRAATLGLITWALAMNVRKNKP